MLTQSAIFLAAAVVAVPIFKRIGLGSVLGYLAAGAMIGPSGLGLIHEVEATMHFAELGVVLLLFLIGLELQPSRLWKIRSLVFGAGGAQVVASAVILGVIGVALGASASTAVVVGVALAMSSTAFALQVLGEKNELATSHGRTAFGVLLFQDLAAIPTLALVPMLGVSQAGPGEGQASRVALVVGVIVAVILAGRFLVRPVFRIVASAKSHELSIASALLVVLGTAILMNAIGLSMALGAFIAGVLLADSEYRHELESNIEPFKGLLLGLFFMAVGMSANLGLVVERPGAVFGLVFALVAVKFAVLFGLARVMRLSTLPAFSLAVALSQGGEFAFVIFGVGRQAQVLGRELSDLLAVVVTLSMAVTPLLFMVRDRLAASLSRGEAREFDTVQDDNSRVIVAGFGRFGQIVARLLRHKKIPFTALEINPTQVDFVRRYGNRIYYGDASRVDLLRAAGADRANLFVLAIDDPEASVRTAKAVQHHFPGLKIIARARNRQHALALLGLNIHYVIRETYLSSLDAARQTLEDLGLPTAEARDAIRTFRDYDENMVRDQVAFKDDEKKLIASAQQAAAELERLFEQDARERS